MKRRTWLFSRPGLPGLLVFVSVFFASCSSVPKGTDWKGQKAYGSLMAQRGFWREALFRFEKAAALKPDDPELQNNIAVAAESLGETARALAAYKRAIELAPEDQKIKRNYARFAEYYTSAQRTSSAGLGSSSPGSPATPTPTPTPSR